MEITRRARLRYTWTNTMRDRWTFDLPAGPVGEPMTPRQVVAERVRAAYSNGSTFWGERLWVGGKVALDGWQSGLWELVNGYVDKVDIPTVQA